MSIPDLDEHGLLPVGIHDCSVEELRAMFGWNEHRQRLIFCFAQFLMLEVRNMFDQPVYADGSFVTDKEHPNDIDVVLDLRDADDAKQSQGLEFWSEHQVCIKCRYHVDFWINLPDRGDFADYFQYIRTETARFKGLDHRHRKGILRIR